jgi:hypothetical protein
MALDSDPASVISAIERQTARPLTVVGLLGLDQRLAGFERVQLVHAYGSKRVRIDGSGQVLRPVAYTFVSVPWSRPVPAGADIVTLKQTFIWQNRRRNQLVVGLAKAAAAGNGVEFNRRLGRSGKTHLFDSPLGVAVVVENARHANVLGRSLPGWTVVGDAPTPPAEGWPIDPRFIATPEGLKAVFQARIQPDVVIRADGGVESLPLAENLLLEWRYFRRHLLVADFYDSFDHRLAARARGRTVAYQEKGWTELDDPHPTPEFDRYLAVHPRGREYRRLITRIAREVRHWEGHGRG